MGSVPIHMPKLLGISILIELLAFILMLIVDFDYKFIFLLARFIYFFYMYIKYRNTNARHHYETETKKNIFNVNKVDKLVKHQTGLTNSRMANANNTRVSGQNLTETIINTVTKSFSLIEYWEGKVIIVLAVVNLLFIFKDFM